MKILFIHQTLPVGGAEELRLTLLKNLNGFDLSVCCIESPGQIGKEIEALGFPVLSLHRKSGWDMRIAMDLYKLIKSGKYDLVQTSLFYANLHGRLAAFLSGVPVVSEEHGLYRWKRHIFIFADRLLARITHRIITCSESVKQFTSEQEGIPLEKFATIHNCVDPNKFAVQMTKEQLRKKHGFSLTDKLVITVGTLRQEKGHQYLLKALVRVNREIPPSKLLIVGSGPQERELRALSERLNLAGSVVFMGTRRDVPELLKMSDLFVLSSLEEGFGIVLLEAMISGLAVIATDVGGVAEVVLDGQTGLLVPPENSHRLAQAIIDLSLDANRRSEFSAAARTRVLENFTPEKYLNSLRELYNLNSEEHKRQPSRSFA